MIDWDKPPGERKLQIIVFVISLFICICLLGFCLPQTDLSDDEMVIILGVIFVLILGSITAIKELSKESKEE